jgi:hypothetical protein
MRDQHRPLAESGYPFGDLGEPGCAEEHGLIDPVDVNVPTRSRIGPHERLDSLLEPLSAAALDANLDHAILARIEPGHLEVDEDERSFSDGKVPRGAVGGFCRTGFCRKGV